MKTEQPEPGKRLAVAGAFLQLGPVIGAIATGIGMMRAFDVLAKAGQHDPRELAGKVGEVLIFTFLGFGVSLIGLILICVALLASRYRAPWLFWVLVADGFIYLIGFPFGTLVGVFILAYCLMHRSEFLKSRVQPV